MTRQPPRYKYNAAQPGFTLEELKEIDDDLKAAAEAAVEAAEEEADGWCIHYQSQPSRLPQLRSYKLLYLI